MKTILMFLVSALFSFSFVAEAGRGPASEMVAAATEKVESAVVKKIREDDDGTAYLIGNGKTNYYLKKTNGNYDSIRLKLKASFEKKSPVTVTYDSKDLNILEVK